MKTGAGLSTAEDTRAAAMDAAEAALAQLRGDRPSLALVFASPHHAASAREIVDAVRAAAAPAHLIGCVGESVVGGAREVEDAPAVSVWLGSLAGRVETFHMTFVRTESGGLFAGWTFDRSGSVGATHLLLADPY